MIVFFALISAGRLPAMLNFTSGSKNLRSACSTAQISKVVTARKFIDLANLSGLVEELKDDVEFIYLEDVPRT